MKGEFESPFGASRIKTIRQCSGEIELIPEARIGLRENIPYHGAA